MAQKPAGWWPGYVWGLFTPMIIGVGVTVLGTVAALVVGKRDQSSGED